jgi:glyoxylase I family protein
VAHRVGADPFGVYDTSMIVGIEHLAIASPDPERLAQWYVQHLDFGVNWRSSRSKTVFVKAPNGVMIEIIESHNQPTPAQMRDAGIRHIAIAVSDFTAAQARLRENGVAFLTEPETSGGNSVVFFSDCDGNILHLLHREKPLP